MTRYYRIKVGKWIYVVLSRLQHHELSFHSEANLREFEESAKSVFACFMHLKKAHNWVHRDALESGAR